MAIKRELAAYPHWFDPNRYGNTTKYQNEREATEARMDMWSQVFFGWSLDEVKGVYLKKDGKTVDEETTQVIKLMFKFENKHMENYALRAGYFVPARRYAEFRQKTVKISHRISIRL